MKKIIRIIFFLSHLCAAKECLLASGISAADEQKASVFPLLAATQAANK